jgi:hypothetical protein
MYNVGQKAQKREQASLSDDIELERREEEFNTALTTLLGSQLRSPPQKF